jgi:hypothetical protein
MNNTGIIFLIEESNEGRYEAHSLGYEDTTGFKCCTISQVIEKV